MTSNNTGPKIVGAVVGIGLIAIAVYSVVFVDWTKEPPPEPPVVRPLKTMVIESPFAATSRRYPGKVAANEEVDLAFQVSGQLIEFPVRKGRDVALGQLIGRLDARDFANTLATRQAALTAAREGYERIERLAKQDMAAEKEIFDSKAVFEAASAEVSIAQKAFDDTTLYAPFAGVIADTFVDNFQNLIAKQPVVSLQDVEEVEIVVNVPEERVVRAERGKEKDRYRFVAIFEYLPGREFDVQFKEFSTQADSATQMYEATFVMAPPDDASILPGMTVTVREYAIGLPNNDAIAFAVPIDAVPIDDDGSYFVWVIQESENGIGTVHRADVTVGEIVKDDILVTDGINLGDRIALAGVHLLREGTQVRPFLGQKGDTP